MSKVKVVILGSTGSIGTNTLAVIERFPDMFTVQALSCHKSIDQLSEQIHKYSPAAVAVTEELINDNFKELCWNRSVRLYQEEKGQLAMLEEIEADIVVNGISGSKGLVPSLKALDCGHQLLNANKESIVMAGPLIMKAAKRSRVNLIPIDSEHFAIFSLLNQVPENSVDQVLLTASGGAFRDLPFSRWGEIRLEDALTHPNWDMGPKNTIDSATMANKGLELIETHYLFGIDVSKIKVTIHPESAVHSLVRTVDGFYYAQISQPDMRMVIQNALTYPDLQTTAFGTMDLIGKQFTFLPVDYGKYRLLHLAYKAIEQKESYPIAFNAANEVAYESFLSEVISFLEIPEIVEDTLSLSWSQSAETIESILEIDRAARRKALNFAKKRAKAAS
jgi:1-deoxy-D-xylulose-5-phosphate reductoisomerase